MIAGIKFVNIFDARYGVKNDGMTWHHLDKILTSLILCLALIFDAMSGVKKCAELYSFISHAHCTVLKLDSSESAYMYGSDKLVG